MYKYGNKFVRANTYELPLMIEFSACGVLATILVLNGDPDIGYS
jgi:hypothetical protein